jgi:hypothetical protein
MHLILITAIVINAIKNSRFYETLSSPMPIIEDNLNDGEVPWFPLETPIPNIINIAKQTMPYKVESPNIETNYPFDETLNDEMLNDGEVPWSNNLI